MTTEAVTLILATVDRLKMILSELDRLSAEPPGSDADLIAQLETAVEPTRRTDQILLRPLRPGEVPLEELDRVFRETPGPHSAPSPDGAPAPASPMPEDPRAGRTDEPQEPGENVGRQQSIRVAVDTLEHLMTMVSELVLTRNQLLDTARRTHGIGVFQGPLQRLSHVTAELQDGVMKTRMQPIGSAWAKLPRLLRDLAGELGKDLDLVMVGSDTELDRQVIEIIRDPLTHMVRNAADHGIETPAARLAAGKPATGTIRLEAFHEGGTIAIGISDDGRGLDLGVIRLRLRESGRMSESDVARLDDAQVAEFIFQQGFSTAETVTSVSGRGVGMDVVKTNIGLIGGTIGIESEKGVGTRFKIRIPLTLAIVAALIVEAGGQRFALPQTAVVELVQVGSEFAHRIERVNGAALMRLRDEYLPVLDSCDVLRLSPRRARPDHGFVVITQVGRQRFGILVDALLETEEIVVKPLSSKLKPIPFFSGNTVLGDGAVVLILNPNGIAAALPQEARQSGPDASSDQAGLTCAAARDTTSLLVFRGAGRALKALPLSLVARLEEVDATRIETLGGRFFLQYGGRLMPILPLDGEAPVVATGTQPLIVVTHGGRQIAIAVGEIVDVVETELAMEPVAGRADLVGSAIVRGRATEIVDLAFYLPSAPSGAGQEPASSETSLLLVNGDVFARDLLEPVLRAAGYRVRTALDAEDALRSLLAAPPDILLTGLALNGRDGLDLVDAVRRQGRFDGMPAILLAGDPASAERVRANELGVTGIVAPGDRPGLLAVLGECRTRLARPSLDRIAA